MAKPEFVWRDVSDVPGIEGKASQAPQLRQALINLGFRSVGYMQRRMPGSSEDEAIKSANKAYADPNPSVVTALTERDEVSEILASPDGRALATVAQSIGGPIVIFRSLSERGWLVNTASDFPHAPRFRRSLAGLMAKITAEKGIGTWPKSGYFERIEPMDVSELWELHKKRVRSILESGGQGIPSHNSVAIFAASSYLAHRILVLILESSARFGRLLSRTWRLLALLFVLCSLCWCVASSTLPEIATSGPSVLVSLLMVGLPWLGLVATPFLAMWVYHRRVQPNLPGPEPMTLDEILKKISGPGGASAGHQGAG